METIQATTPLIKDTLVLHLNSQTNSAILLNGDNKSNLFYDLRNYLDWENDDSIEYVTCSLPYAIVTNSNYIVNENNCQNSLTINAVHRNYNVPFGNYTRASWITTQQYYLDAAYGVQYFVISSDSTTNKFTITVTAAFIAAYPGATWGFGKPADPGFTTSDYIWGFRGFFSTTATSYTMDRCFNFLPIPRFLFHANILSNGISLTNNSATGASDIIAAVPNVAKLNSQIIYENNSTSFQVKTQVNMSGLNIKITDDDNRLINFNGISCYFDIKFDIYRRSIKKPQKFSNLIKTIQETVTNKNDNIILEE